MGNNDGEAVKPKTPNPIDVEVGAKIRARRRVIGMSQVKLGEALGVTFQQVQKYEKGLNCVGASRLSKVADILGVPVSYFFKDQKHPSSDDDSNGGNELTRFIGTEEGRALNQAFIGISSASLRKRIINLVRSVADADVARS